jgi:hypothetical protein
MPYVLCHFHFTFTFTSDFTFSCSKQNLIGRFSTPSLSFLSIASGATTKKSKMKIVDGAQIRLVTYPHPKTINEDKTREIRHYGDSDAALDRLVMSIPNHVQGVPPHSQAVDQVMVQGVQSKRLVAFMVGNTNEPPAALRALSHSFKRYVVFGYMSTTDQSILKRFQIKKTPALVVMFEQPGTGDDKPTKKGDKPKVW